MRKLARLVVILAGLIAGPVFAAQPNPTVNTLTATGSIITPQMQITGIGTSSPVCTDVNHFLTTSSCNTIFGNVFGPGSSTNGDFALFNGSTGKTLLDGGAPAASAFTDTTNASNIASGTLSNSRLNIGTSGAVLGLLNSNLTLSGNDILSGSLNLPTLAAGSLLCTDGSKNMTTTGCSAGGVSGVSGPVSSIIGDFVLWNNTTGSLVSDGGVPGTAAFVNIGTSGATVPLNNGNLTLSGNLSLGGTVKLPALTANSLICLDSTSLITTVGCSTSASFTPTLGTGWGTGATIAGVSLTFFSITVGTTPSATATINISPAAPNAIFCYGDDITTQNTQIFVTEQVGVGTTTQVTVGNYTNMSVSTPWIAGDVVNLHCQTR